MVYSGVCAHVLKIDEIAPSKIRLGLRRSGWRMGNQARGSRAVEPRSVTSLTEMFDDDHPRAFVSVVQPLQGGK